MSGVVGVFASICMTIYVVAKHIVNTLSLSH